jgi:hypothetical protein
METLMPGYEPYGFGFPVNDGVCFTTHGNYGSTEYDPINEKEKIAIFICDKCLIKNVSEVLRFEIIREKTEMLMESFSEYKKRNIKAQARLGLPSKFRPSKNK